MIENIINDNKAIVVDNDVIIVARYRILRQLGQGGMDLV